MRLAIFLSLFVFIFSPNLQAIENSISCQDTQTIIDKKIDSNHKYIQSIKSLMGLGGDVNFPLNLLFQVDLNNQEQITRRLGELEKQTDPQSVSASSELHNLSNCLSSSPKDPKFKDLVDSIIELNTLKITFFKIDTDKRKSLVDNYNAERSRKSAQSQVDEEIRKTEDRRDQAQKHLANTETNTDKNSKAKNESLLIAETNLQQYLIDSANEQLSFLKLIAQKKESLENIRAKLREVLKQEQNRSENVSSLLASSTTTWEETVDFISGLFNNLKLSTAIDLPEALAPSTTFDDAETQEYAKYIKSYEQAQKERVLQAQNRTHLTNSLRSQAFQLLSESGQLRSRLFSLCDATKNCQGHRDLNSKNIEDVIRELEVIPVRLQAGGISKALEFKAKLNAGLDGWIDLSQQIIALFLLLFIPFALLKILGWANLKLDSTRKSILSRSMMDFRKRTSVAVWISRLNPFVPATGMVLGIWLARKIIQTTDLKEFSDILFYLQLYFVYRIFRLLVKILLEILFSNESVIEMSQQKKLAENSAKRIARLVFLEYAFLHLIETSVRKALIYGVASSVVFYFNIIFIFWESYRWRNQIIHAYLNRFPKNLNLVNYFKKNNFHFFWASPFLLASIAINDLIIFSYSHLIKLDFVKRIHSEIFRRRIENDADEIKKTKPSEAYISQFDYYLPAGKNIFVKRQHSPSDQIVSNIDLWVSSKNEEDIMLLVGNRGMGKTTILNSVAHRINPAAKVHQFKPKTLTLENFYKSISEILNTEIKSIEDVLDFDNSLKEKTIVFIDDIQNLFLGKISGFEVYKNFVEILSLKTKNIFWCISVNSRSWAYLKGCFGTEHLYSKLLELTPWKDYEIQELILSRHNQTGYSRQFDQSIKVYGATGDTLGQQAETQFFRLLWGQSRGNPRSALMYWISAIAESRPNEIIVGVPSFINSSLVSSMSDDSLFLLASIARHESLTQQEMIDVTTIQNTIIRKCMKEALDKKLVWVDFNGRYRITSQAQYVIDYYLMGKNFLYE